MKNSLSLIVLVAACSSAFADNFVRLPIPGLVSGGLSTGHPATSHLPTSLPGEPPVAKVSLSANELSLGDFEVGQTSPVSVVSVKNTGRAATSLSVAITGDAYQMSTGDTSCGASLPAGGQCQLGIIFSSKTPGQAQEGAVTVTTDNDSLALPLRGSAHMLSYPQMSLQPLAVAKDTAVSMAYTSNLVVSNVGNAPMRLGALKITEPFAGEFSIRSTFVEGATRCVAGLTVSPGGTCVVIVRFVPYREAVGREPAVLTIANDGTDAYGQVAQQSTTITYSGVSYQSAGILALGDTSVAAPQNLGRFKHGQTDAGLAVVATNRGTAALDVTSVKQEGTPVGLSHNCATVSPGLTCTLDLNFTSLAVGEHSVVVRADHTGKPGFSYFYGKVTIEP